MWTAGTINGLLFPFPKSTATLLCPQKGLSLSGTLGSAGEVAKVLALQLSLRTCLPGSLPAPAPTQPAASQLSSKTTRISTDPFRIAQPLPGTFFFLSPPLKLQKRFWVMLPVRKRAGGKAKLCVTMSLILPVPLCYQRSCVT